MQYGAEEYKRRKNEEMYKEFAKNAANRKKYALALNLKTKEEIVENQIIELNNRKSLIDHMIVLAQEMLTND